MNEVIKIFVPTLDETFKCFNFNAFFNFDSLIFLFLNFDLLHSSLISQDRPSNVATSLLLETTLNIVSFES